MMRRNLSVYRLARYFLVTVIGMVLTTGIAQAATFQVTSIADSGSGSLRQAIEDANNTVGADSIDLSPIESNTITLESSLPEIVEDLSLQGSDVTLDGAGQHSCLAAANADLSVDAMTITQCGGQFRNAITDNGIQSIKNQGGAIRVELGNLTLSNTVVTNNAAPEDTASEQFSLEGGGVFVSQAETVSITNSVIQNNTADEGAGGIHIDIATQNITITDSFIAGNISSGAQGGALLNAADGDIVLINITVSNNEGVTGAGGLGAESLNGAIAFSDSLINGNRSVEAAGGASLYTGLLGDIVLTNVEISNNESDEGDGGLLAEAYGDEGASGSVVVTDSVISDNRAIGALEACPAGGSTLLSRYDEVEVSNTVISGNIGQGWAFGGLTVSAYLGASVEQSTVTGNDSEEGGGGLISLGGLNLSDSLITDNSGAGGGLMHFDFSYGSSIASLEIANSTLSGNTASSPGGGAFVYSYQGDISIESSTFSGNSAETGGGLLLQGIADEWEDLPIMYPTLGLTNSTISDNSAASGAGVAIILEDYTDDSSADGGTTPVKLEGVTITGNNATAGSGGGLAVMPDYPNIVGVNGSIIFGNGATEGGADLAAPVEPANTNFEVGVSLIGEAPDDGSVFVPDTVTSSLLGTDPQLGALADNGGPTPTHLPALDSPAVDIVTADDGCGASLVIDQRGKVRPGSDGSLCDAGSVERQGIPQITAAPDIDFGDTPVLDAAPVANANLENLGVEPLEITAFNGPNAPFTLDFFDCSDVLPFTLLPGEGCVLSFGFLPTSGGMFNETVAIESNSDSGDNEIALSGRGTVPELSIADLDFGDLPVGSASEQAITLTNTGEAGLLISGLALSGDAVFELLGDDCAGPVAPGADCSVDIQFTPDAAGDFFATLVVTSNATDVPVDVGIIGRGTVAGLGSTGLDFDDQRVGNASEQAITLTNTGDADLLISNLALSGDAVFELLGDDCAGPVAPGADCSVDIRFTPDAAADFSATLAVSSNASESPVDIGITGQGIVGQLMVTPSGGINFGDVQVGTTGEGAITLRNNGDAPIEINGWNEPEPPFAILGGNCPESLFSLQASESCTLILGFSPVIYGNYDQVLNLVVDDGSGSTSTALSISGRGTAPIMPVPALGQMGLIIASGLLALLGLLGLREGRTARRTRVP